MDDIADVLLQGFLFLAVIEVCNHRAERLHLDTRLTIVDLEPEKMTVALSTSTAVVTISRCSFVSLIR